MQIDLRRFLLPAIIVLAVLLGLYKLDDIPGEMWGDIVVGYDFTDQILEGKWPFHFVLGNGPLFFYVVALFASAFGLSFLLMKVTSVVIGVVLVVLSYYFARQIGDKTTALLTAFLLAVSKWPLTFSRLGNMSILVPVFVCMIYFFLFRALKREKWIDFLAVSVVSAVGLFSYPSFLFVPISLGIAGLYVAIRRFSVLKRNKVKIIIAISLFILLSMPFFRSITQFDFESTGSYFGSKFFVAPGKVADDFLERLGFNIMQSFLMFHVHGDEVFRVNVTDQPHLDIVSGIFMLIGMYYLLKEKKLKNYAFLILMPLIVLQLPAILVVNFTREVPSATRTIGILPFLYVLIAIGIRYFVKKVQHDVRLPSAFSIGIIALLITGFNAYQYFHDYRLGLPNKNTPFAKIIAREIDKLPSAAEVSLVGCCWGDWGQPEPNAVLFMLSTKDKKLTYLPKFQCDTQEQNQPKYLFVDPAIPPDLIQACFQVDTELIQSNGYDVVRMYTVVTDQNEKIVESTTEPAPSFERL